jgi:predicted NBD/HSP70 family sugar kinase
MAEMTLYCGLDVKETRVHAVVTDDRGRPLKEWEAPRSNEGFLELMRRLDVLQRCTLCRVVVAIPAGDAVYLSFGWPYSADQRVQARVVDPDELFFLQELLKKVAAEDQRAFMIAFLAREERLCRPDPIEPWYLGF